jgi:hypothetical protein
VGGRATRPPLVARVSLETVKTSGSAVHSLDTGAHDRKDWTPRGIFWPPLLERGGLVESFHTFIKWTPP